MVVDGMVVGRQVAMIGIDQLTWSTSQTFSFISFSTQVFYQLLIFRKFALVPELLPPISHDLQLPPRLLRHPKHTETELVNSPSAAQPAK